MNYWILPLILSRDCECFGFRPCSLTRPLVSKTLECFANASDASKLTPNLFTLLVQPGSLASTFSHFLVLTRELIQQKSVDLNCLCSVLTRAGVPTRKRYFICFTQQVQVNVLKPRHVVWCRTINTCHLSHQIRKKLSLKKEIPANSWSPSWSTCGMEHTLLISMTKN